MSTTTEDLIIDAVHEILNDHTTWSAEFLSRKFWNMNSSDQANFFNILSNISKTNRVGHKIWTDMQWRYMQDDLTPDGKELINNIKAHTDPSKIKTWVVMRWIDFARNTDEIDSIYFCEEKAKERHKAIENISYIECHEVIE